MNSYTSIEPFVDADKIAAFLDEPRKVIIKMAREGMITAYPFSGNKRKLTNSGVQKLPSTWLAFAGRAKPWTAVTLIFRRRSRNA